MNLGQLRRYRTVTSLGGFTGRIAPKDLALQLAKLIRRTPPERLDAIMRSPIRQLVLEAIFWQMPRHLDRRRAAGINASIRWRITGRGDGEADIYDLVIADGRARVKRGGHEVTPRLTITVDAAEFMRVAAGSSNPVNAYFNGKLALRGDVMQAARLTMLFRIPSPGASRTADQQPRSGSSPSE